MVKNRLNWVYYHTSDSQIYHLCYLVLNFAVTLYDFPFVLHCIPFHFFMHPNSKFVFF